MKAVLNGKEMKEFDARSIKGYGIPSLVLMERAAMAVAEKAEEILEKEEAGTVWSVCGFGNNGADGVAAARMLFLKGYDVKIVFPQRDGKGSEELEAQLNVVKRLGIPVMTAEDLPDPVEKKIPVQPFRKAGERKRSCRGVILDAIFGIGLSRNVEGAYRKLIRWINGQEDMKVIAVDVPSGISSDNGSVMGDAVRADVTVTFGEKKLGQVLFPGRELCGHLFVKDVGFVPESSAEREKHVQMLDREDLLRIPARMADSNKGTYGKVLVMAGAKNMAGASLLSARAAYRMGAGLVKVFTPEENRLIVQEKLPEAILATYDTKEAEKDPENFARKIARETEWADVIVLGPGIGMEDYARCMVENVLKDAYVPIILDADALNLAAEYRELTGYFTENIIVTPHMKEMSRLTGIQIEEMKENPVRTAREFADQYGVVCVLKDAATVIAGRDGKTFVNGSGTPAMAKGGSGDVLTGVIAGLVALGLEESDAAALGVYVHGLAGEAAEKHFGVHGVLAGEITDCLSEVYRDGI